MQPIIALLGRRDSPTDALEDYCTWLGEALGGRRHHLEQVRVPWLETGWRRALWWLWQESAQWRGEWVLVQYTAMSWSRRGLAFGVLAVLSVLRGRSCRVAVVFHDPAGFPGPRWSDRGRRAVQHWIMRIAYRLVHRTIHNVPVDYVRWLPKNTAKAVHIPVGANVPAMNREPVSMGRDGRKKTVVVFGVTGGESRHREARDIALAVNRVAEKIPHVRLVVLGRGSREAEEALRLAIDRANVELSVLGLLPAEEVSRVLAEGDALLFVRGAFSGQRASGIAGIACGLPVVGYAGSQTGPPLTEAGVLLVPYREQDALATALVQVLSDDQIWQSLRRRSVEAYRRHFSWDSIAQRLATALGP